MVLNKREKELMNVIYRAAIGKGQCLITPYELLNRIPYKIKFKESDLEPTLIALREDGYFDLETATRKNEPVYVITLKELGQSYMRDRKTARIKIIRRVATTIAFALLGYLIKVIISAIIG